VTAGLAPVRTEIERCSVCKGLKHLARDHWAWGYLAQQAKLPTPDATRRYASAAFETYQGRCWGCGGHGKVLASYDTQTGRVVAVMHYDDRGLDAGELPFLPKMNPSA
jgi:hypothetical protein